MLRQILFAILAIGFFGYAEAQFGSYYDAYMYGQHLMQQQQQANQQAYERGRQLMQNAQTTYDNNPANAAAITGSALNSIATAFMYQDQQSIYDKAFERLKHAGYGLDFPNALYWMGVMAESDLITGEDLSDAIHYYEYAADAGHSAAKKRLRELSNGARHYSQDQVLRTLRENAVAANSVTLPSMQSVGSSSSSGRSNRNSSTCPKCGGSGYEYTSYRYSASADSYHNSAGYKCRICGGTSDHYHYRCIH